MKKVSKLMLLTFLSFMLVSYFSISYFHYNRVYEICGNIHLKFNNLFRVFYKENGRYPSDNEFFKLIDGDVRYGSLKDYNFLMDYKMMNKNNIIYIYYSGFDNNDDKLKPRVVLTGSFMKDFFADGDILLFEIDTTKRWKENLAPVAKDLRVIPPPLNKR